MGQTIEERKELQNILKYSRTIEAPQRTGIVFEVGDERQATIHSEPDMKVPRLFLSIVPGSAEDV